MGAGPILELSDVEKDVKRGGKTEHREIQLYNVDLGHKTWER